MQKKVSWNQTYRIKIRKLSKILEVLQNRFVLIPTPKTFVLILENISRQLSKIKKKITENFHSRCIHYTYNNSPIVYKLTRVC